MDEGDTVGIRAAEFFKARSRSLWRLAGFCGLLSLGMISIACAQARSGSQLADQVASKLYLDPAFSPADLKVNSEGGTVTLSGWVGEPNLKEYAVRIAKSVRGVTDVRDRLDVRTVWKADGELRGAVLAELMRDPTLQVDELKVHVKNGRVALEGIVGSWEQRDWAQWLTGEVDGVREVRNEIVIQYETPRSDLEIAQHVLTRLRSNPWSFPSSFNDSIQVRVEEGKVLLSGEIHSANAKDQARRDAWVSGVTGIESDDLVVVPESPGLGGETVVEGYPERKKDRSALEDAGIEAAVRGALYDHSRVKVEDLRVNAENSVVMLRGRVESLEEKQVAERAAKATFGVAEVVPLLEVVPPAVRLDREIISEIRESLKRTVPLVSEQVSLSVERGRVRLSGVLQTPAEKGAVERVAARVMGVVGIQNDIEVEPLEQAPTDSEMALRIEDRITALLSQDADIQKADAPSLAVSVEKGVATLEGTVGTWAEYLAATQDAFLGGAQQVVNRLKMGYALVPTSEPRVFESPPYSGGP